MTMQKAITALGFVPPHDRDTWVRMGMAIKSEFAEDGFDAWDAWSQGADSYDAKAAKAVWRSISAAGKLGIGSLFREASANGWRDNGEHRGPLSEIEIIERRKKQALRAAVTKAEEDRKHRGYRSASAEAQKAIELCEMKTHYYLNSKGLGDVVALVSDHTLIVPMRDFVTGDLAGMQSVSWNQDERKWEKKMQFGMRAKGSVLRLGSPKSKETFLCEGYATGLSIDLAIKRLRLNASVLVCFSDSNMVHVASMVTGKAVVIADNDESKAGEKAALKTGLQWVMSDVVGEDANDLHKRAGLIAVCSLLMVARMG